MKNKLGKEAAACEDMVRLKLRLRYHSEAPGMLNISLRDPCIMDSLLIAPPRPFMLVRVNSSWWNFWILFKDISLFFSLSNKMIVIP